MNHRVFLRCSLMVLMVCFIGCGFSVSGDGYEGIPTRQTYISRNGDKEVHFAIPDKDVPTYPSWKPGSPLPYAMDQAIGIAMKELPKYAKNGQEWGFRGVSLTSLHTIGSSPDKWIYLVQFEVKGKHDLFEIPVAMNGAPIIGVERPLDKTRWSN